MKGRLRLLMSLSSLKEIGKDEKKKIQVKLALAGKRFDF